MILTNDVLEHEGVWLWGVILISCGSNAPFSHIRGGPYGETHAWGPPLM